MNRTTLLGGLLALALACPLHGADWPRWRGPNHDAHSPDKGLLKEWPKDGPPLAWKAEGLGKGYASVAIAGDHIYTMGDRKDGAYLICLARKDGKEEWAVKIGKTGGNYEGPRSTPTVEGKHVWALGQFGDLVCVDSKGKEIWRKNLEKDFGGEKGDGWNYSESVLIDGDNLICTPGGKDMTVVALKKLSGETVWKSGFGHKAGHSSIVPATFGGVKQYVQLTSGGLVGLDAKDGTVLWKFGEERNRYAANTANIPTPLIKGDMVFASVGYGRGGALLKITKDGNKFKAEEQYWERGLTNKHGGFVLVGDFLYGDSDANGYPGCHDFSSGKEKWRHKERVNPGNNESVAVTYADGHLYFHYGVGLVTLVEATPDKYIQKGSFKIPNTTEKQKDSWAHPVVLDGKLYLREKDVLWVYDVKGK